MMKTTLKVVSLLILFFIAHQVFAQSNYWPGYIIDLNDQKITGFIDYQNWDESPRKVNFKKQLVDQKIEYAPKDIKQFGVKDEVYIGAKVATEVSPYKVHQLSYESALDIDTAYVFIQTIIQGNKSLYHYKDGFSKDNFYILRENDFQLLYHKKYIELEKGKRSFRENKQFIGQLAFYLRDCPTIQKQLDRKEYTKRDLEAVFVHYYNCTQSELDFQKETEKIKIELGVVAGLSFSTINFIAKDAVSSLNVDLVRTDFSISTNFSAGLFLDLILPRSRNKWSFYNELFFSSYEVDGVYSRVTTPTLYTNDSNNFQFAYLKLNNLFRYRQLIGNANIFINAGISNGIALNNNNSRVREHFSGTSTTLVGETVRLRDGQIRIYEQGLLGGLGIQYNRLSLEFRYEVGNGMTHHLDIGSVSKRTFVLLGYRF